VTRYAEGEAPPVKGMGFGAETPKTPQQAGQIDEATSLPLNDDGTVTIYHATRTKEAADEIRRTGILKSGGEPDVYVSTAQSGTGYGDHVVALRVDPKKLVLDDEFPDGRRDFRINTGKSRQTTVRPETTPEQAVRFETPGSPEWEAAKAKGLDMSQAGRMGRAGEQGYEYARGAQTADNPFNETNYAMFARARRGGPEAALERIEHYGKSGGKFLAKFDPSTGVDASDLVDDFEKLLSKPEYSGILESYNPPSVRSLAEEIDPRDIVDGAGIWDAPDLVEILRKEILEPRGITHVRTSDGLISFDPSNIRSVNAAFDPEKS
jgi:hypothetical protein